MTPDECLAEVLSLLPTLPAARAFYITASALQLGASLPPAEAPTTPPPRPPVHVLCRDSSASDASFAPISGLGRSGALAGAGYFEWGRARGELHVIADRVRARGALRTLLAHELVHALDAAVHGLDLTTCGALACSELRAAASADCAAAPAWWRRRCARNTAAASAAMVFPSTGAACVDALFDACVDLVPSESPLPVVAHALAAERAALS